MSANQTGGVVVVQKPSAGLGYTPMDSVISQHHNSAGMDACLQIPDDILRVLIMDVQECLDKETEIIVELIRQNQSGIEEPGEAALVPQSTQPMNRRNSRPRSSRTAQWPVEKQ